MDEAERCHALAYIAYGKLLANGTAAELVARSGIATWAATGENLHELARELRSLPGIEMVVPFGTTLHVSGSNPALLENSLAPYRLKGAQQWTEIEPGLEDVFIGLMNSATDNFQ
jgi:ABC-2 type transport system ATP-binding protein